MKTHRGAAPALLAAVEAALLGLDASVREAVAAVAAAP